MSDQPGDPDGAGSTDVSETTSGIEPVETGAPADADEVGARPRPVAADEAPADAPVVEGAPAETPAGLSAGDGATVASVPAAAESSGTDRNGAAGHAAAGESAEGGGDGDDRPGDEDEDDVGNDEPPKKGNLLTRQVQIDARTILIIVAVLAVGVGAYVLGQVQARDDSKDVAAPASSKPPSTGFEVPKDYVPFDDKETGIKLAVPKDWVAYSTQDLDKSYRLLVGVPNAKDNLRVRMNAYSTPVTAENIKDQQAVVDSIFAQEKIQVLAREMPTVNGMPALYYVYKFTDSSGEPGYHAHFFVFQGRKMVSLVFEAVPEARFVPLAPVFDSIANSLQVAPGDPPAFLQEATGSIATGPATTTPGATTAPAAPPSSTP